MENYNRFSHGVMSVRQGVSTELSTTESAEALMKTLTLQPDYLLRTLTPLPMESLDELIKYKFSIIKSWKKKSFFILIICPILFL